MENLKQDLVVIVPVYNAVQFCKQVISDVMQYADQVILVDGASTDGSDVILKEFANENENVHLLTFSVNKGKGASLNKAFKFALEKFEFKALLTIDSDGQHEAKEIPILAKAVMEEHDMAIGTREFKKMPLRSRFGNSTILRLVKTIYGRAPRDSQSGFRAFSYEMAERLVKTLPDGRYETEFDALLHVLKWKKKIFDHQISTIYIENNRFSNFMSLKDSYRVIKVMLRHFRGRLCGCKEA